MSPRILDIIFSVFFMIFITICIMWPITLKETLNNSFLSVIAIILNFVILKLIIFLLKRRFKVSDFLGLVDSFKKEVFSKFYNYTNRPFKFTSYKYSIEGFNGVDYYSINRKEPVIIMFSIDSISFKSYRTDMNMIVISSEFESNNRDIAKNEYRTSEDIFIEFIPFEKVTFIDKTNKKHIFKKLRRE